MKWAVSSTWANSRRSAYLEPAPQSSASPLRRRRRVFEGWTAQLLLHRLTVDPDLDVHPALERTVRALGAG